MLYPAELSGPRRKLSLRWRCRGETPSGGDDACARGSGRHWHEPLEAQMDCWEPSWKAGSRYSIQIGLEPVKRMLPPRVPSLRVPLMVTFGQPEV